MTESMPIHPEWSDIALRLLCTIVVGGLVGLDRGEHARPAGLRTTLLVSLAACLAMLQANLLLATSGKSATSFVNFDVMRLPLGILSGMGFIGAGAIVRRENLVLGVTTAATLWFVTVVGLCFGGGQIMLGVIVSVAGLLVLSGLRRFERAIKRDRQATLSLLTGPNGPTEEDLRTVLQRAQYEINTLSVVYSAGERCELTCQVSWRGKTSDPTIPPFLQTLNSHPGVTRLSWTPQAV